ncbi:hypothetical protein ECG_08035 [Echinococcus granulosus]|nr:hypothetical protein ECG_08034 [Echinococcus granulosus]KAH9279484.1 hypothetical protein ECG_08035 [Echinococcus granulosus]
MGCDSACLSDSTLIINRPGSCEGKEFSIINVGGVNYLHVDGVQGKLWGSRKGHTVPCATWIEVGNSQARAHQQCALPTIDLCPTQVGSHLSSASPCSTEL